MGRRSGGYVFSCGATTHKVPHFRVTDRHRKHIVPQCLGNVCVGTLIATSVISPLSLPSSWAFGKVRGCYWLGMEVYLKGTGVHLLWQWEVMICNWCAYRLTSPFLILIFVSNHMCYWGEACDILSKLSYTNIYSRWPIRLDFAMVKFRFHGVFNNYFA